MNPAVLVLPIAGGVAVVTAAKAAAAMYGLSVLACLAYEPCRNGMMDAIQDTVAALGNIAIEMLRVACELRHELYKITEQFCEKCNVGKAPTFVGRVCRCSHSTAHSACWLNVATMRAGYIFSGCDYIIPTNADHVQELQNKIRAAGRCVLSAQRNCGLIW